MANDDLDPIPPISATRDGAPGRPTGNSRNRSATPRGKQAGRPTTRSGGSGLISRILLTLALVVAGVACAWVWQLQQELQQADTAMQDYAQRIGDLEARLSDTDQGMSQNAEVQAAKIRELDSEVRKLWDNVWKKSKERLDKLEATSASQGKKIAAAEKSLSASGDSLKSASADIARLKSVAGDLDRLMASARTNQSEVERVADTLNRINLDLSKLSKRVQANEEWVASINTFRQQVNASLAELRTSVRSAQVPQ